MKEELPIISEELVCKWCPEGEGNNLVYLPSNEHSALVNHYKISTKEGIRDAIDLTIKPIGICKIRPSVGVLIVKQAFLAMPGDIIAHHTPGEEAVRRKEMKWEQRRLEAEKAAIAKKLKERHRKRELEKIVMQELIDSGELFGEQPKRPPIPREVVDAVYRRDGGRCVYCGSTENLQLDHIIPFSKGGATTLENLQLLCQKCNLEKSNHIG